MSISFNQVPNGMLVPFLYAEFNASNAIQGAQPMPYQLLVLGQMLSGTATANVAYLVSSEAQAITLFGAGSVIHGMIKRLLQANQFTPIYAIAQIDAGGGVAASGTITVTGSATAAGTIAIYIAGRQILTAVAAGDTQNSIAANINAAIAAQTDSSLPVSATVSTNAVTLTAKNKGPHGNGIDIRTNYYQADATPAGVSLAIVAMASGAGVPSLTAAIAAMGEVQYNVIAMQYNDSASTTAINNELISRWGPTRQNDGVAVIGNVDTQSNLVTFGGTLNSQFFVCFGIAKSPTPFYEIASSAAGIIAYYGDIDQARPFQTLGLPGVMAPALTDRFTLSQRNTILGAGVATMTIDPAGNVLIERAVTTYKTNGAGAVDPAYRDVNTVLTLSYLRWDFRNMWLRKYSRYKLAADGTRVGPGQAILTPKAAKAEIFAKFREWEEAGLVQNFDAFKQGVVVQLNQGDVNRLDILIPPSLVTQLMVTAVQFGFILGGH